MEQFGVVVLAAGLGKRMRSAQAKVLHRLAGQPLLTRVLDAAQRLHPDTLVVVVGHQADEVQHQCGREGVAFALQEEQRGTGDAVRAAQPYFDNFHGNILIVCGDTPLLTTNTLSQFVQQHRERQATLSVLTIRLDDPAQYGRVIRTPDGQVCKIVEARDATEAERAVHEINSGIYCVRSDFLFSALQQLQPQNAQGEYYLTDIVAQAVTANLPAYAVLAHDPSEVGGINSREDLAMMEKARQAQLRSQWMAAGVTLEDPDTVYIEEEVMIGQDTIIGPNTQLRGKTTIGERCRIDGSAYILDSKIGNDAHVRFSVVLNESELGNQTDVGPFAHLRGGTVLAPKAEIGNFVEVKKSLIGEHTKAKHLAYIGDAEIGRDANIGAGTITCNYDGFRKHKTKIGDRVQVGSDTTLIAPITIHDDVYIATATTVRRDVPAGALVFNSRQEQVREGWTASKRAKEAAKKA
ncbi:MAG: bifunctional UDP-N-acetylglucosamine diphosphorylase/glucosamine-1-phosphate N-acetyltransferase GlmU [Deltaproteobacteria bacterium]|nr:bifunctional UDP-N-acetylglucosamine diphosphorylase/glucosamine-1-phosphate N-acetyltransferase GlmU [Deltaproteobacteria bacterium]